MDEIGLVRLTEIIARLQHALGDFWTLVWAAAWVTGAAMAAAGLAAAGRRADQGPGQGGWAGPAAMLLCGCALLAFPSFVDSLTATMIAGQWEHAGPEIFARAPELLRIFENRATRETIIGILRIIQFVGLLAIFRGVLILNAAAQPAQRGTVGAGLTHLVGGGLAVNIGPVLDMIEALVADR